MKFKDIPNGLFRRLNGIVYTKINDSQAVLITNGNIVDVSEDEDVIIY